MRTGWDSQDEYKLAPFSEISLNSFGFKTAAYAVTTRADLIPSYRAGFGETLGSAVATEAYSTWGSDPRRQADLRPSVELLHPLQPNCPQFTGEGGRRG